MYSVFLAYSDSKEAEAVRAALDSRGLTLAGEATDGESAVCMVRDLCPDILITDVNLPFFDGMVLAGHVHKVFPWIQIIILGGSDDLSRSRAAKEMGVEEYLIKPVRPYELVESLQRTEERLEETRRNLGERILAANRLISPERREDERELGYWLETGLRETDRPWPPGHRYARVLSMTGVSEGAFPIALGILRLLEQEWRGQQRVNVMDLPWGPAIVVTENTEPVLENLAYGVAYTANRAVKRFTGESVCIRIGPMVDSMEGLRESWAQLKTYPPTHSIMSEMDLDCGETVAIAKDFIDANYGRSGLLLQQTAREAGITVNRLCVLFEQYVGVSFTEYLFRLRIAKAQRLLAETRMRVSGIAQSSGFHELADFAALFRHRTGQTPQEYRRACQAQAVAAAAHS